MHDFGAQKNPWRTNKVHTIWVNIDAICKRFQDSSNMVNRDALHDLAGRITSLLPDHMQQIQDDLESNIHGLLQNTLSKMNLVTREEFDVQTALLERTRDKLERLEQRLSELEEDPPFSPDGLRD